MMSNTVQSAVQSTVQRTVQNTVQNTEQSTEHSTVQNTEQNTADIPTSEASSTLKEMRARLTCTDCSDWRRRRQHCRSQHCRNRRAAEAPLDLSSSSTHVLTGSAPLDLSSPSNEVSDASVPIDLSSSFTDVRTTNVGRSTDEVVVLDDSISDVPQQSDDVVDLISDDEIAITLIKSNKRPPRRRRVAPLPLDDDAPLVAVRTMARPQDTDVIVIEKDHTKLKITDGAQVERDSTPKRKMLSCPVCLDHERTIRRDGRHLMSTKCGHIFCNECILKSIASMKCCPMCKVKLNKKTGIHPLYAGE